MSSNSDGGYGTDKQTNENGSATFNPPDGEQMGGDSYRDDGRPSSLFDEKGTRLPDPADVIAKMSSNLTDMDGPRGSGGTGQDYGSDSDYRSRDDEYGGRRSGNEEWSDRYSRDDRYNRDDYNRDDRERNRGFDSDERELNRRFDNDGQDEYGDRGPRDDYGSRYQPRGFRQNDGYSGGDYPYERQDSYRNGPSYRESGYSNDRGPRNIREYRENRGRRDGYDGYQNEYGGGYQGGGYNGRYDERYDEPGYRDSGYSNRQYNQGYNNRYNNGYGQRGGYQPQGRFQRKSPRNSALAPVATRAREFENAGKDPYDPINQYEFTGALELHPNGYGFLRRSQESYIRQLSDPFVPGSLIEKYGLREGVLIKASVQPKRGSQGPRVREILEIEPLKDGSAGMKPEEYAKTPEFDELIPVTPWQRLRLETGKDPVSTRVMDLFTPLGKGQRALIVAPPRSGKTVLLKQISQAITLNYPDVHVIVLLIDERPEEVTDFKLSVNAEIIASSLDCELESHIRLANFVTKRCKRLVESGKDVFLLLDSITRLARAFNKWVGNTGRTMSGGVDIKAMDVPKKIFSCARQCKVIVRDEEGNPVRDEYGEVVTKDGGSLTIVGTALVETGSRMDDLIFQEFKGTGNMELVLTRDLADRRIWPAIDIRQSGTRHEEKLMDEEELNNSSALRRTMTSMDPADAMQRLVGVLEKSKSNEEFFSKYMMKR